MTPPRISRRALASRLAEAAIAVLRGHEALSKVQIVRADATTPLGIQAILVDAEAIEQAVIESGVFRLNLTITARVRLRRRYDAQTELDRLAGAVEETMMAPEVHEAMTNSAPDPLHVYHAEFLDSTPEFDDHAISRTATIECEAMPCTMEQALAAYAEQTYSPPQGD